MFLLIFFFYKFRAHEESNKNTITKEEHEKVKSDIKRAVSALQRKRSEDLKSFTLSKEKLLSELEILRKSKQDIESSLDIVKKDRDLLQTQLNELKQRFIYIYKEETEEREEREN